MIKVKLKEGVSLPKQGSKMAVGFDVTADNIITSYSGIKEINPENLIKLRKCFDENGSVFLRPYERMLFGTGITVADMPEDVEIQVRCRSGLSLKRGLQVFNTPGTIDPDYRGEIGVILYNATPFKSKVFKGENIAQLVVVERLNPINNGFQEADFVTETERGEGGYGSTDKN